MNDSTQKIPELAEALEQLEDSRMDTIIFDILLHTISFKLTTNGDRFARYAVVFNGVSTFYFVENVGKDRFKISPPDPTDWKELTTIGFYPDGIGKLMFQETTKSWAEHSYSSANFVLGIFHSSLFIEAKSITINRRTFEVGYPTKYG